jgi:heme/copper-type cytochrome/quinol oxidase subunit 2
MAAALKGPVRQLVLRSVAATSVALALSPASALAGGLTPESPASPNADDTQLAYVVMVVLGTVIALAMIAGLIGAGRGRASSKQAAETREDARRTRGTSAIQRRVGAALGLLALVVFIFGVVLTEDARQVEATGSEGLTTAQKDLDLPADSKPLEIEVSGQQWLWRYEYPDGTFSYEKLVVPVDTEVVLNVISTDILHRWWVPALGPQVDAVPGQFNHTWFKADEVGTYEGRSTQFSGPSYAQMRATVDVVTPTEYEGWLAQQADDIKAAQDSVSDLVLKGHAPGQSTAETDKAATESAQTMAKGDEETEITDAAAASDGGS